MNKFLVVGLGNPGQKYQDTRHNVGFKIIDRLVKIKQGIFEIDKHGEKAVLKIRGQQVIAFKPHTFMNLSGKAVNYHLIKNKINTDNLLVVTDDIHLPFGQFKIKRKGSDGGHNGHKDIIEKIKTSCYPRLKFGVGDDFNTGGQSRYVLSNWSKKEEILLDNLVNHSVDAIINFCTLGVDNTMLKFN